MKKPVVTITAAQISQLTGIAKNSIPNESCAVLIGERDQDHSVVADVWPVRNADNSPFSFSISPGDLLRAYEHAREKKLEIIGIFHSHPGNPAPSGKDREFMELNPVVWIIYSNTKGQFKAFIDGDQITEVEIEITE